MTSPRPLPEARSLATKSPWLMIAIMLHVAGIAIASILYYAHETTIDDDVPMHISIGGAAPETEAIKPVPIEDRNELPNIRDDEAQPNELLHQFHIDANDGGEVGDPTAPTLESDMVSKLSGDTGATAIGVGVVGHFSNGPSTKPGTGCGRPRGIRERKGDSNTSGRLENAVTYGLDWLSKHQDEDGRWDCANFMKHDKEGEPCTGPGNSVNDVGVTGLALIAFLGDGNTMKQGPHRKVVQKGVRWLLEQQQENGLIGTNSSQSYAYSHAIATVALCEAYGLSEHRPLKKPAQAAISYIANARNPYGVWRYQPRENDGDTSITGWMVQALLSGRAFQLQIDDAALKTALVFLDSVTDPVTGSAGYTKAGEGSSRNAAMIDRFPAAKTESLTAVALLCRHLLHQKPTEVPVMAAAAKTLVAKPPVWNPADGSIDMYYWYYASYALYQHGGKEWEQWGRKMTDAVVRTQVAKGNASGSWDPVDAWGEDGGRVYSTAMMVLCLEAYWRYGRVSFAQ